MSTTHPTTCPTCQGLGSLPTKGHRFYAWNATLCPCGMFRTLADAGRFADELRMWVSAVEQAELAAARKAARHARRAAR